MEGIEAYFREIAPGAEFRLEIPVFEHLYDLMGDLEGDRYAFHGRAAVSPGKYRVRFISRPLFGFSWWKFNPPVRYFSSAIKSAWIGFQVSDDQLPGERLEVRWAVDLAAYQSTGASIAADGTVFMTGKTMSASDAGGNIKWELSRKDLCYTSCPMIAPDGTVYAFCGEYVGPMLKAVHPDGTVKWTIPFEDTMAGNPALAQDGTVYFPTLHEGLCAINPDGSIRWKYFPGGTIEHCPIIGRNGTIYFGCDKKGFYAINPDGTEQWSIQLDDAVHESAAIGKDGTVYIPCDKLYAVTPAGKVQWTCKPQSGIYTAPIIGGDGTISLNSTWFLYTRFQESRADDFQNPFLLLVQRDAPGDSKPKTSALFAQINLKCSNWLI